MLSCPGCQAEVHPLAKFCSSCGKIIVAPNIELKLAEEKKSTTALQSVIGLYFIMLVVCIILKFTNLEGTFFVLNVADLFIDGAVLIFAAFNFHELKHNLFRFSSSPKWAHFRWWVFPVIIVAAVIACLGVDKLVNIYQEIEGHRFYAYMYEDTAHPFLWAVIGIALQPAIFEELAFRGVMFNKLKVIMDPGAVIIVTGMLFAILHLSPVSMIWLLPFGLIAGWMRNKSGHLWYGITLHFFYNLTSVVLDGWSRGWFDSIKL
ncbi:MAG: CPBP family glutamic-type intramembrane protease [Bacteroidota bacterium]|nr:CPBP family glutamic-type intramembrane protease [Bacteroidota bacterium]